MTPNTALSGWFCRLVPRKDASFIVLLLWLWLAGFSKVGRARVGVRVRVRIRVTLVSVIVWGQYFPALAEFCTTSCYGIFFVMVFFH